MISMIHDLKAKFGIEIHEGENFKQACYNGKITDTADQLKDKIELAMKHYPGQDLIISTYSSDDTLPSSFAYSVVVPVN